MAPHRTPSSSSAPAPWPLAGLTLAVLIAHGLLLGGLPNALMPSAPAPERAKPMQTRAVPAPPSAQPAPAPAAAPAPVPRRSAKPQPTPSPSAVEVAAPTPAPADTPVDAPASDPPSAQSAEAAPVPDATSTEAPAPVAAAPAVAPEAPTPTPEPEPAPASLGPVAVAPPAKLNFEVEAQSRGLQYHARAELLWTHDGERYEVSFVTSAFLLGSRSQTSVGRVGAQGLEPSRFADRSRNEVASHFDRERQRIVFSTNRPEVPLLPGAQDRLSLIFQLGALLAGDPARYPPGTQLSIQTAGPRDAGPWLFTVEADETLQLAGQSLPSARLVRLPRHQHDLRLELWLARNLAYLPVRILVNQANGDSLDQQLKSIESAGLK